MAKRTAAVRPRPPGGVPKYDKATGGVSGGRSVLPETLLAAALLQAARSGPLSADDIAGLLTDFALRHQTHAELALARTLEMLNDIVRQCLPGASADARAGVVGTLFATVGRDLLEIQTQSIEAAATAQEATPAPSS